MPRDYDYKNYRKIRGKVCLENTDHETIAKLLADGDDFDFIARFFPTLTRADFDALLVDKYFLQRIDVLKAEKLTSKEDKEPTTPDDYVQLGLERLEKLSRSAEKDDKNKIEACRAMVTAASIAKKNAPKKAGKPPQQAADMSAMKEKLMGGVDTGE